MSKKRKHRSAGRFSAVTSCMSTTLVLILLGTAVLFTCITTNFSRSLREQFTLELLLSDDITAAQQQALGKALSQRKEVRKVRYISKEQGTKEMNEALQGGISDLLGASPIPAEYEVALHAEYATLDSLVVLETSLRTLPGITDVVYPREAMEALDEAIPAVSLALMGVALLLAFISFSLINNTIRMNVYARRFSILTMKLVGAPWRFIRRPFMTQAFLLGLVAATLASGVLAAGMYALQYELWGGQAYFNQLFTEEVWYWTLGTVYAAGLVLTLLCAFFSVTHHLRLTTDEVYLK